MNDLRHLNRVTRVFYEEAHRQEKKGIEKYGKPLDPLDSNYDWLQMAIEEQVDGFKYLMAEKVKRDVAIKKIRKLLDIETSEKVVNTHIKEEIVAWLDILEGKA